MSPASYLAAPPRDAGPLVAPVFRPATILGVWNWAIYGALSLGFLAVSGAAALVVVRGLRAWRDLKRLRRGIARELNRLADLGEATADKVGVATDNAKLETSLSRLRVDLARFAILRRAIDEVDELFQRVAWVFPRR